MGSEITITPNIWFIGIPADETCDNCGRTASGHFMHVRCNGGIVNSVNGGPVGQGKSCKDYKHGKFSAKDAPPPARSKGEIADWLQEQLIRVGL